MDALDALRIDKGRRWANVGGSPLEMRCPMSSSRHVVAVSLMLALLAAGCQKKTDTDATAEPEPAPSTAADVAETGSGGELDRTTLCVKGPRNQRSRALSE